MQASGQANRSARARPLLDALLIAMLLLLGLALNLTQLGAASIFGDEAIYAVAARNAAVHGDWYPLRYEQQLAVSKPPLALWTMAASFALFGVSETSARLPSALIAALLSSLVFVYARFSLDRAFACFASIVFSSCPPWLVEHGARAGVTEPLLCLSTLAAFAAYLAYRQSGQRSWAAAAAGCVAVAGLSKGLFGPLTFLLATTLCEVCDWLFERFDRRSRIEDVRNAPRTRPRNLGAPLAIFVVGICPYLVWVVDTIARVPNYPSLLYADIVTRATSGLDPSHLHPANYYAYVLSFALDHWGLLMLPIGVVLAFRNRGDLGTHALRLAAFCACVVFVVVSCAASKLPWYVYPALPAMAILIASAASAIVAFLRNRVLRIAAATIFCLVLASRVAVAWTAINEPARVIDMERLVRAVQNEPRVRLVVDLHDRSSPQFREWNAFYLDEIDSRIEAPSARPSGGCAVILTDREPALPAHDGGAARVILLLKHDAREQQLTLMDDCGGVIATSFRSAGSARAKSPNH